MCKQQNIQYVHESDRKVADSIPDGVFEIIRLLKPSAVLCPWVRLSL